MAWVVSDAAFFDSFTQGTFETFFASSAYPQNTITRRYRSQNTFIHNSAVPSSTAYAGTGAAVWRSADVGKMLQMFCGKPRTNGRRYTVSGRMRFFPSGTPGIWDAGNVVNIKFGMFAGLGEVSYDIRDAIGTWMAFTTQVVWTGTSSTTVDAVDLSVRYSIVSATIADPLNGSDIYFDNITAIEETDIPAIPLSATYTKTDVTASGGSDGTINVTASGGSTNYSYSWADGPTTANRSGLPAGTYTITVTDTTTLETVVLVIAISEPAPTPVSPGSMLEVPFMNSLTYVVNPVSPDDCDEFQQMDNVLFCQQEHEGFEPSFYYQKVATCDEFPTQFNTDFDNIEVTLLNYETDALVKTFTFQLKEQNIGLTEDFNITIRNHTGFPGQSRIYFNVGAIPIPLAIGNAFEILNNIDGYDGTYTIVDIQLDESFNQFLVINKNFTGPGASSAATGRFTSSTVNFNVYESPHDFADVAVGLYFVKIRVWSDTLELIAISEPIDLKAQHKGCVYIEARNNDNAEGLTFTTGYIIKLRVPAIFFRRYPGGKQTVSRNSNYSLVKTSGMPKRVIQLQTYMLPPYLHEKLAWLFLMDFFSINKKEHQTEETYADPQYLEEFMLANSSIKVEQKELFDNYNSDDLGSINDGGFITTETGFIKR